MANIVKTFSFVNGQPADGTQVNKDFDDIITGVGDLPATYVPKAIVTAKGDLVAASAAAAPVCVPVGTNGKVLTANDAAPGGVDWEAAASGYMLASDALQNSFDAEATSTSTTYAKMKSIQVPLAGTYRIKFDLKGVNGYTEVGKIYVNGVAVGTDQATTSGAYATFSGGDFPVVPGSTIELWGHGQSGRTVYAKNFRLYGTVATGYMQV